MDAKVELSEFGGGMFKATEEGCKPLIDAYVLTKALTELEEYKKWKKEQGMEDNESDEAALQGLLRANLSAAQRELGE